MRSILSPLVGVADDQLRFGREQKGRPFLCHPGAPDFNLSDTIGGTLVAVCLRGRVGADLERIDRSPPVAKLATRWYSAAEASALAALPADAARIAFLHLWTAKEASCKATGTGIFGFLDQWIFDPASTQPRLQSAPVDADESHHWWFARLAPTPAHTAVIALRDHASPRLACYTLLPE